MIKANANTQKPILLSIGYNKCYISNYVVLCNFFARNNIIEINADLISATVFAGIK